MSSAASSRGNKVKKSYANCPAIQLLVRDNKGWRLYKQHHKTGKLSIQSATKPCTDADITFSMNGEFFAVLLEEGIEIYESLAGRLITSLKHYRVRNVYFSPFNNFMVSYHHRRQDDKHGNCWVWKWDHTQSTSQNDDESKKDETNKTDNNFKVIYQFFLPEFDKKRVPLQFTNDEMIAARITRNAVLIHDVKRLHYKSNNIIGKLDIAKVASVVVAPCRRPSNNNNTNTKGNNSYLLAVFAMPKNNKAATVTIYEYQYSLAMNKKSNKSKLFTKISQRAFYGVDQCELLWDPSDKSYHHNLLAIASSDVDTSGKSYYGNQTLYLLSSRNNITVKIPISEKGKLQDVKWSCYGKEFVMIDDHPQKISVFDYRGNTICSLGQYARNLIRFSNDGRFLWCGGFGNLTGEMTFYDYKQVTNSNNSNNKGQCLGYNTDDACRYFEWSPDSSTFLTARLYPYMTVDNGFRIYKYNGHKLCDEKFDRLYQIAYRPSLRHVYPSRSPSPNAQRKAKALPKPSAKKRYVPPHLRPKKSDKTKKTKNNNNKAPKQQPQPQAQSAVQPVVKQPAAKPQSVQSNQRQNYQQNRQQNYQQNPQQNYQPNYQQNYQQHYQQNQQNYQQNQQYGQNYYNQQNPNPNQNQYQNNMNYPQQPQEQNQKILQDAQNQSNQMNINNNNNKDKNDKKDNDKAVNKNNNNNTEGGGGDGGGNKKKKRRKRNKNKNKNKQNQDNSTSKNAQGGGTNSGGFKPGLADNDNRRWARGSKVDTNQ